MQILYINTTRWQEQNNNSERLDGSEDEDQILQVIKTINTRLNRKLSIENNRKLAIYILSKYL